MSLIFIFFVPPLLLAWGLEYGVCHLTRNCEEPKKQSLWQCLPLGVIFVLEFLALTSESDFAMVMLLLVSMGALIGWGVGWLFYRSKHKREM